MTAHGELLVREEAITENIKKEITEIAGNDDWMIEYPASIKIEDESALPGSVTLTVRSETGEVVCEVLVEFDFDVEKSSFGIGRYVSATVSSVEVVENE